MTCLTIRKASAVDSLADDLTEDQVQVGIVLDNLANSQLNVRDVDVEQRLQGHYIDAAVVDVELVIDLFVDLLLGYVVFSVDRVVHIQHSQIDELADDLDTVSLR